MILTPFLFGISLYLHRNTYIFFHLQKNVLIQMNFGKLKIVMSVKLMLVLESAVDFFVLRHLTYGEC